MKTDSTPCIKPLYAIRDNKVCEFNAPTSMRNNNEAMRSFEDLVTKDTKSLIALHPADFSLYFLGYMNMETGEFIQDSHPTVLATGSDFILPEVPKEV